MRLVSHFKLAVLLLVVFINFGFSQEKWPYPVIFVHGYFSNDEAWHGAQDKTIDNLIQWYDSGFDPVVHVFHAILNAQDNITLYSQDVDVVFSNTSPAVNQLVAGDLYTINF